MINLASIWKLPLILICENNLYAVETDVARASSRLLWDERRLWIVGHRG